VAVVGALVFTALVLAFMVLFVAPLLALIFPVD